MCPKRMRGDDGFVFHNISISSSEDRPYVFFLTANVSLDFPLDDPLTVSRPTGCATEVAVI